jgi:hypothetical protein
MMELSVHWAVNYSGLESGVSGAKRHGGCHCSRVVWRQSAAAECIDVLIVRDFQPQRLEARLSAELCKAICHETNSSSRKSTVSSRYRSGFSSKNSHRASNMRGVMLRGLLHHSKGLSWSQNDEGLTVSRTRHAHYNLHL